MSAGRVALADADARRAIVEHLDRNVMVEAAAGTGKTTSLVSRMVSLVRSGRARAAEMAAITFTVKAAAQLRERFQEGLEAAIAERDTDQKRTQNAERRTQNDEGGLVRFDASGQGVLFAAGGSRAGGSGGASGGPSSASPPQDDAPPQDDVARLRAALGELDRAFLGTTHAFCARLLRERPVEAGLDPEFSELDEQEARLDAAAFFSGWWERKGAAGDPCIAAAKQAGIKRFQLATAFQNIVDHPDLRLEFQASEPPPLRRACERVVEMVSAMEQIVPVPRSYKDAFETMVRKLLDLRGSLDLRDPDDQLTFLQEANHASKGPVQMLWPDKATAKKLGQEYTDFVTDELRPLLERWNEYVHGVALSIIVPAAAEYAQARMAAGTLSFADLLVRARDLLRDHPEVRRYFQKRYRYVLVDEFQDTDPVQAEVLFYLTGSEYEEKRWRKLTPRAGSLFIVGDPKQSIYRFRRADISTYLEVRERIAATGGEILQLSTNFRSTPAICTFVNESFSALFRPDEVEAGMQAAHVDLVPHREDAVHGGVFLFPTIVNPGTEKSLARQEGDRVAAWIRVAVESGTPVATGAGERTARWGDFLLVSRQRTRLREYTQALEEAGVPYEVTGASAFQQSEELALLQPLLRAILDPDDAIPLVAFLRGPLCGVDDDALYRFRKGGGRFSWQIDPPEEADPRIVAGLAIVREAGWESRSLPPAAVLGRLIDRLGLQALAATLERGETRSGNLALALAYARSASSEGASFAEVVELLDTLAEKGSEVEEMNIDPARANAVRLMNLHQVKGLEAPFVFLIDPADPYDFPIDIVVERGEEESVGHFPLRAGKYPSSKYPSVIAQPRGWKAREERAEKFRDAEVKRLLYVAATRARQWLVIGLRRVLGKPDAGVWAELGMRARNELPSHAPSERTPGAVAVEADAAAARAGIESRHIASREESYSVLPVTRLVHENQERLARAEEGLGRGTSWGRVLHSLFEAILKQPGLEVGLLAENLLKDEEREPAELEEVLSTVAAVISSGLWQRVLAADERLVEVPFALEVPAAELGIAGPQKTLLHGTVDLMFREGSTWHVIDYKSDSTTGRLDALVAHYAPQVRHYAAFWRRITGAPTKAGLFFVDGCREVWVDL